MQIVTMESEFVPGTADWSGIAPEQCRLGWTLAYGRTGEPLRWITDRELPFAGRSETSRGLRLMWRGSCELGDAFTVTAEFRKEPEELTACFLEWSTPENGMAVEEAVFPQLTVPYSESSDFVTALWDMGWRRRGELRYRPGETERIPCESMQFSALLEPDGACWYFDHRDPERRTKALDIVCSGDRKRFTLGAVFFPSLDDRGRNTECRIPYPNCFRTFRGGWFEAARIYRRWALQQHWHCGRSAENPLREIDLWVWNRGRGEEVVPPVEALAAEEPGIRVALTWYWWHCNPYDTDYPEFWPPRGGEVSFRQWVARLNRIGIYSQVYVNGLCWDMDAESWTEGGPESAVILRDGSCKAIAFNRFNHHRLAYMCGESPKFGARLERVVKHLRDAGLSGQYLDMIGCGTGSLCRNPSHRHEKHGGNYNVREFRRLLRRLGGGGFPLTTECANEAYMCETDGAVVCSSLSPERIGFPRETLPLFSAVYHGRYALFGNYACIDGIPPWDPLWPPQERWKEELPWHRLYPDQFFLELARTVVWGVQPMVCNLRMAQWEEPEFAGARQFLLETARFWRDCREFLFDGEMLAPGELRCGETEVAFLVRMIFTKEAERREVRRSFPAVLHSRWRAPSGETALILANYTEREQDWEFGGLSGTVPSHSYRKIIQNDTQESCNLMPDRPC